MSGFNTKERNDNGEYEITFYTENRQDFEKVQDLCRELIDHNKIVSNEEDLISRSALKKAFETVYPLATNEMGGVVNKQIYDIIDNAPAVEYPFYQESYQSGYEAGKNERPQGELPCE